MSKPLVNKKYLLEKFPGKGGWTFAAIPEIMQNKNSPFGWVKVRGAIDGIEINQYHLMPMGDGRLFLPVKAEIRKKIKKQEGDYVQVTLYPENNSIITPEEMLTCLAENPAAKTFYATLSEGEQKYYIQWIYSAKKEETKTNRMIKAVERLSTGMKMYDKLKSSS
ncbi:MAG: YdeI/OmpD-associated family protein [Saprospiraceae bacterium]